MSLAIERGFSILETLVGEVAGLSLGEIASRLDMPKSATHRTLNDLLKIGYVRQEHEQSNYILSIRIVSIAQRHLAKIPLVELAKPFLERISRISGEKSRLGIVDGEALVWVAKHEGQRAGLQYDPDAGKEVKLSCSASGLAWLATMKDEEAIALVEKQGFADNHEYGTNAPRDVDEYLVRLHEAREVGYGYAQDTFEQGVTALAMAISPEPGERAAGVINFAGPSARLSAERCEELVPLLQSAAEELATLFRESSYAANAVREHGLTGIR